MNCYRVRSMLCCVSRNREKMFSCSFDLLGISRVAQDNDAAAFEEVFAASVFKSFTFNIKAKAETYREEMKTRCNVSSARPINYSQGPAARGGFLSLFLSVGGCHAPAPPFL